jgi:opacity protein-like surface antigen
MRYRRILQSASAAALLLTCGVTGAQAQIRRVDAPKQSIGFNVGYFGLRSVDSRAEGDVLFADLFPSASGDALFFQVKDFNGATVGGEWLVGVGDFLEAGVGASFYQRTVPSVYADVFRDDGFEIAQDLKLRVIPLTATVRFLPIGRGSVEPYVGAGIGAFNWRYSETGEFVDSEGFTFRDSFSDSGTAVGPVVLGGIRFPIADLWSVGGEVRYQKAEGKVDGRGLLGDKIDLGGWTTSFTMHLRF